MQTNLLPASIMGSLDKANRTFLWGGGPGTKKIPLVPWEQVCKSRDHGGIGIRPSNCHYMALTLIMKLIWRMIKEPESLWVKLLKGKYLGQAELFNYESKSGHKSFLWRSIMKTLPDFQKGMRWSIRNGTTVRFWKNPWICQKPLSELLARF